MAVMTLEKTLRYIALAGVFTLPFVCLLITESLFFPYITGKNFAFRIIVEIMAGAWLALACVNPAYRPRRSSVLAALALFVLVIAVADATGVHPFKSFWSNYERMDGWVTLAHLLLYTVAAASIMNAEVLWRRLFQTSLAVSAFMSVYGYLQMAGFSSLGQGMAGLNARIDARFGNPIYLAVYMLFHVFIAAMLWAQSWVEKGPGKRTSISLAYGSVMALDTLTLFLTGTRGTMLGIIGGGLITALLLIVLARNSRNVWRITVGAVVAFLVIAGGFWLVRDAAWVQRVGFLSRLATISTSDNTVQARFINWSIAWKGVQERPLLGWGQENYAIVFDKYYDPRMYAQEPWFDRVHNIIFDWLIAGGFLGLFTYLAIFGAALSALWRSGGFTIAERSILTGLFAAYFFHNLFVFDNVTSYILFGTVLAYIAWRSAAARAAPPLFQGTLLSREQLPYAAAAAALLVWGVAWYVNAGALAANRALLAAVSPQQGGALTNLEHFEKAISYGAFGTQEAREQLSQTATQIAQIASVTPDVKQKYYDRAVTEMEAQAKESPLDARFPLFLGLVHGAFGDYAKGAAALDKAHKLSLAKQSILYEVGQNAFARGDVPAALSAFQTAFELEPASVDARRLYAAIAIRVGDYALAGQLLEPILASGDAADPRILAAYVAQKALARAIPLWEARVKAQPDDVQAYFTLAALYYETGNAAKAIAALEAAKSRVPSIAAQANSVIEQIRNGTARVQ